jgi:hypothetical protein
MTISNITALKKAIASHKTAPLDDVVKAINISLELSVTADNKARHHRLNAGRMLLDLRRRVEGEGTNDWWKWQEGKFARSRKDIEKLMRMAKADDPEAAAELERTQTRERVQAHRALERTVRSEPEPPPATQATAAGAVILAFTSRHDGCDPAMVKQINALVRAPTDFTQGYIEKLNALLETKQQLSHDALDALYRSLALAAEEFERVANVIHKMMPEPEIVGPVDGPTLVEADVGSVG